MTTNVFGMLTVASAFCLTYGFLFTCQWLGRRLAQRGLTAEFYSETRRAMRRSDPIDCGGSGPTPDTCVAQRPVIEGR
jgi:hypothetical protein